MILTRTSKVWCALISTTVFVIAFQTCIEGIVTEFQNFTHEGPMDDESFGADFSGNGSSSGESEFFSTINADINFVTENSGTSPLGEDSSHRTTQINFRRADTQSNGNLQHTAGSKDWSAQLGASLEEQSLSSLEDVDFHFVTENGGTSEIAPLDEDSSYKTTQSDFDRVDSLSSENLHRTTVATIKLHNSPAPFESGCCECAMDSVHESNLIALLAAEFAIFDEF